MTLNFVCRPIPPFYIQQAADSFIIESFLTDTAGIAGSYGVWGHILCHHRSGPYDNTIADGYTGQNGHPVPDPHIVSDAHISFRNNLFSDGGGRLRPMVGESLEWIGGYPVRPMIAPQKNADMGRNGAKFSDGQGSPLAKLDYPGTSIGEIAYLKTRLVDAVSGEFAFLPERYIVFQPFQSCCETVFLFFGMLVACHG